MNINLMGMKQIEVYDRKNEGTICSLACNFLELESKMSSMLMDTLAKSIMFLELDSISMVFF